ncbi:MAG: hypothetical protein LBJ58_01385 [Tannerellaceae bacterium]|nr:hypothetical protein [Tannerellaceae bacterium]
MGAACGAGCRYGRYRAVCPSRKPKANRAVHRYGIKLNDDDNVRFTALFLQSGMNEKAKFIRNMILRTEMKTVKIDKAAMDYYVRLTNLYA